MPGKSKKSGGLMTKKSYKKSYGSKKTMTKKKK